MLSVVKMLVVESLVLCFEFDVVNDSVVLVNALPIMVSDVTLESCFVRFCVLEYS